MTSECPLHRLTIYRIVRCTHIGDRYVVQMESPRRTLIGQFVAVAYADQPHGELRGLEIRSWNPPVETEIATAWEGFVERLRADDPPTDDHRQKNRHKMDRKTFERLTAWLR